MSFSRIRHNFAVECEAMLNKQINMELHASYVYQSMASYFHRDDVALKGFHKFFQKLSQEEREHSNKLMKYVNERGGAVVLHAVNKAEKDSWGSGLEALEAALQLEKTVYQSLLDIHKMASSNADPHLTNWLEDDFLNEQVETIYQMSSHITNLKRVGTGLGEYLFDKETLDS
ncbi:hypothetical protein HELRODRAFT_89898 [Helobdella robusta]|uniref:Ferritin n=1 Tax=Helobdella robusta TaxID=6412 RepID=T1G7J0_HELRO|nr:hypothetical protein HELRODRAFT_89898 [Helobdella robusta]ESN92103.1 hypothetical protein HELRODRAFT_89898 [Helobdella robusta]